MSSFLRAVVLSFALSSASAAAAQDAEPPASPTAPPVRIDLDAPSIGLAANTLGTGPSAFYEGVGVRAVARTGDGGFFSASMIDSNAFTGIGGATGASSGGLLFDMGYLRRFRLVGDDRFGLGLDVQGGFSVAELWFSQGGGFFCGTSCRPEPVPESLADGLHAGVNVGGSIDFRAWDFTVGIDVRYRALAAMNEGHPGDEREQHVATFGLHLGFGIY